MLTTLHERVSYHRQAAKKSLSYLTRTPTSTLMTIFVIGISLALPGFFWILSSNVSNLSKHWQRPGTISLYIDKSISSPALAQLQKNVQELPGVEQATLISPFEGMAMLQQEEGMQDIMQFLAENPLPPVIAVTPNASINSPFKIKKLYTTLRALPSVEQAKLDLQWITRLYAILNVVTQIAKGLMALLLIAVIFIIGNTLRLALHHRHEEIQVLKLIGAPDAFILRPFLYSGVWYGLAGGLLAVLLIKFMLWGLSPAIEHLVMVYQLSNQLAGFSFVHVVFLLGLAALSGWVAVQCSVKSKLARIEPKA